MPLRKSKRRSRNEALLRYHNHRNQNLLAQPGKHQFAVVLDHLKAGFNVAKIFRSADVFSAQAVHLINIGPFDPAPAKGGFKRVPTRFHETFATCFEQLKTEGYTLFTLEATSGVSLFDVHFPEKCAFIFGHEERGLSFNPADHPEIERVSIPQFGQTESLNVSVAASIVMYEYTRQQQT
ncbi:MAG: TrmH family RNA methyltransferase [Sedimenticola sp.]|nr:MAG: TrmH family RNA methyltransferase [Sedimenticola sp.]